MLARQRFVGGLAAFRRGDNAGRRCVSEVVLATAAAGSECGMALGRMGLSRVEFRNGGYRGAIGRAPLNSMPAQDFTAERVARVHPPARIPLGFRGSWVAGRVDPGHSAVAAP